MDEIDEAQFKNDVLEMAKIFLEKAEDSRNGILLRYGFNQKKISEVGLDHDFGKYFDSHAPKNLVEKKISAFLVILEAISSGQTVWVSLYDDGITNEVTDAALYSEFPYEPIPGV